MGKPVADAGSPLRRRVVDYVVRYLAASRIEFVFGVDGANIEDLYDAAHFCDGIEALIAKHEFSAAAMADGYSRSSGRLGVVAATSGGGSLNLAPGLGESLASRIPVLALVGQPQMTLDGQGSFQDMSGLNGSLNAEALFSTLSLYCRRITSPEEIVEAIPEAFDAASRGGPAVLLLPKDVQQARLLASPPAILPHLHHRNGDVPGRLAIDLDPAVRMLGRANGPITIVAGEQVARDNARAELESVRRALRASVATVPQAKDVIDVPRWDASSSLGVTGVMGHPRVVEAIRHSGVCLVVGTRLPVTARTGLDDALVAVPTISMGSAPPYVPCTQHIHTEDLRTSLAQLVRAVGEPSKSPAGPRAVDRTAGEKLAPPSHAGPGVRYSEAMAVLNRMLPDGADIVVDAGNCGASAIHHLPVRRAGRFVVALGMGGMGYSFGAGIGMALGRRRRSVVIAGDGAFFMHGLEIHTAIEYRLPVMFVLFNNNAHAMCVIREQMFFGNLYSYNRFRPSRLGAGLGAMFPGLTAIDVSDINAMAAALDAALKLDGPSVISVECSTDEIPPFTSFLVNATPAPGDRGDQPHGPAPPPASWTALPNTPPSCSVII